MRTLIVVPCFQESARLDRDAFDAFIDTHPEIEVVLVNDGSSDGTLALLQMIRDAHPTRVTVIDLPVNVGKAEAVRQGVQHCLNVGADYFGYWDADLATPLDVVPSFVALLEAQPAIDIVLGARVALLGRQIDRQWTRHYLGRVFATAASITLNLPVYDTQCGAKLVRSGPHTRHAFEQPFRSRWIFDVELIARYLHHGGSASGLYEAPVPRWRDTGESKVKTMDFVRAVGEMAQIFQAYPLQQPFRGALLALTSVFSRYALMGAVGTVMHYATLLLCVEALGLSPTFGAVSGATLGAIANYILNYHLTFASHARHRTTFPRFVAVALLGIAVSGFGVRAATAAGASYMLAQVACTLIVLFLGYLLNRLWTFSS